GARRPPLTRTDASRAVLQCRLAVVLGAAGAAVDGAVLLDPVAHHAATAVRTLRRQGVDGTLERIEGVFLLAHRHRERLVVVVAAHFAFHDPALLQIRLWATGCNYRARSRRRGDGHGMCTSVLPGLLRAERPDKGCRRG